VAAAGPPPGSAVTGAQSRVDATGPQPRVDATSPRHRTGVTGPQPGADAAGPVPPPWGGAAHFSGFSGQEPVSHGAHGFAEAGPDPVPQTAHPPAPPGSRSRSAFVWAPLQHQQKLSQIKDLYREAGEMGDAELSAHWEELRLRQQELIREYFEQAGLGSADIGQSNG
jgi:hypothetical protein